MPVIFAFPFKLKPPVISAPPEVIAIPLLPVILPVVVKVLLIAVGPEIVTLGLFIDKLPPVIVETDNVGVIIDTVELRLLVVKYSDI